MSDGVDLGKIVTAVVWPRREEFETGHFYGWRVSIAVGVLFLGGTLAMHIALACGLVSLFGFTGFAQANDVSDIKRSIIEQRALMTAGNNEVMAIVVGGQIFDLRTRQCAAVKMKNYDAISSYSLELQGKLELYQRVSGRQYPLQQCP